MRAYTSADSGQVAAFGNCFVGQTDIAFTECADKLRDIVGYRAAGAAGGPCTIQTASRDNYRLAKKCRLRKQGK